MENNNTDNSKFSFAFSKENYKLVLIGLGIIIFGFILMAGGGSDDPNVFDESIFSFTRITLAPIVVLLGFGFEIYAIMHKPDDKSDSEDKKPES